MNELKRFDTHTHSEFSNLRLIDSINKIPDIILTASKLGMAGVTLTDHESLSGHLRWLQEEKRLKESGVISEDFKCALGNEIYLVDDRTNVESFFHFILIAKNADGHKALRELSSTAWYNGFAGKGQMRVPTEKRELEAVLQKYPKSLVATTACIGGELGKRVMKIKELSKNENDLESAAERIVIEQQMKDFLNWGLKTFGEDFYIEIAAGTSKDQIYFNKFIKDFAWGKINFVIGSDAHYLTAAERPVHKAYLNSKEGEREVDTFYFDAHMMDNEEAFKNLQLSEYTMEDFEKICQSSMTIYDKIESFSLEKSSIIPEIKVKEYPKNNYTGYDEYPIITYLLSSDSIQERYWVNDCIRAMKEKGLENNTYLSRLETEADIIKFVGDKLNDCLFKYFNTYQHYIDLFWECGSIVGPGRGSSVCFLSNYLMGITQLDPVVWGLKEWRFLNKERVELPDIDTDICPSKRQRIFKAIRDERTEKNVLQVCTFGTEGSRSAVAAAGRGYRSEEYPDGLDVEITQYLSGLIPQERGFLWSIHDVVYGDEEKDRKPITAFVNEVNKYPGLLEIIESIEGLVNKRGQHASGVIMYNETPYDTNAIMRSPNGDITTQMSLHDAEAMGDVKYDMLVTEISDKIAICLSLLRDDSFIPQGIGLKEIYDEYLHPSKIDVTDNKLWDALGNGEVLDVFQFSTGVGLATAKQVKPKTPMELTSANALMRLMGEKGKERPLDRYCRLKDDIQLWYDECHSRGLSDDEIKILEPYYLPNYGVPASQEDLMEVCMDPNIGRFTLGEANAARKIVAKKQMNKIPDLKEKFISQCPNRNFGEYVWETTMGPQMGYAFAKPHALAYSFVGIQTLILATHFPSIYWNCACLIINAGGAELIEADDVTDEEEETDEKKKNKSVNYGKISIAIGESRNAGINVMPPDINKSKLIFTPDMEQNAIIYGLKGINRIGTQLVYEIMKNRPYTSIEDFISKIKVNKVQMINLIKAGIFDSLYPDKTREDIMHDYISSIADQKKRITLQNMQMLIAKDLIPLELDFEKRLFNFNKYLKKFKSGDTYILDEIALKFFRANYNEESLTGIEYVDGHETAKIKCSEWDNTYQKGMDPVRAWMKDKQSEILDVLNQTLWNEAAEKYADGSISKWEMDSLGFYYHEHELAKLQNSVYGISDFNSLPEEPEIDRTFKTKDGEITMYKISRICGTVIDKDKNKSSVTLLTPTGVVTIKVWKNQYAAWDRQLSERGADGVKHVVEKSWFQRGTKLIVTGIRRGDDFVPKKYKSTELPLFEKVIELDEKGFIIESATERVEVE